MPERAWQSLVQHNDKAHGALEAPPLTASGHPNMYGRIPYRFPAAVRLDGLGLVSDALNGGRRWDDLNVIEDVREKAIVDPDRLYIVLPVSFEMSLHRAYTVLVVVKPCARHQLYHTECRPNLPTAARISKCARQRAIQPELDRTSMAYSASHAFHIHFIMLEVLCEDICSPVHDPRSEHQKLSTSSAEWTHATIMAYFYRLDSAGSRPVTHQLFETLIKRNQEDGPLRDDDLKPDEGHALVTPAELTLLSRDVFIHLLMRALPDVFGSDGSDNVPDFLPQISLNPVVSPRHMQ
ncbi:uncharacterized protein BKCO1_830004 [Diplodia corticola]|uniref:Uncharacterized protein n=1 Tax=Diplodia corticola TaxID=236234 RepID=A0A1J9QMP7_9PEZI|nr:uncharacterized protein BKCO1_830004 [Diplodia corticola]OJD29346.1 hypothetical protein BKCO1_830004 [Diplodia corticola]